MIIRLFDIVLSLTAILLLSPLLMPIVLILRFTGENEILFSQKRVGYQGREFELYKFATMLKNSPNMGTGTVTTKNDPRILPVGHFLRRTKINELPQIFNVLLGDMSLIGPRPLTRQTYDSYSDKIQKIVITVRPGLSGIGSIMFRNEEEILSDADKALEFYSNVIAPYKGSLEAWWVANKTLLNYLKLIVATIAVILFPNHPIVWRWFPDLPAPPDKLKAKFN